MRENTNQNNSEYGHLLRSVTEIATLNVMILEYFALNDKSMNTFYHDFRKGVSILWCNMAP